jgi:hypothetical protein
VPQQGNAQIPAGVEACEQQADATLLCILQGKQKLLTRGCGVNPLNHMMGGVSRAPLDHLWGGERTKADGKSVCITGPPQATGRDLSFVLLPKDVCGREVRHGWTMNQDMG